MLKWTELLTRSNPRLSMTRLRCGMGSRQRDANPWKKSEGDRDTWLLSFETWGS